MDDGPILVGYDGSPDARTAVSWALDEASRTGRPVELAYAFEWLAPGGWAGPGGWSGAGGWAGAGVSTEVWPDEQARQDAERLVAEAVAEASRSRPGVAVRGDVLDGPPAPLLQDRSANAELVVLGSRGYGGFTGLLVGSTAVAVSAHAHCPVVVVRGVDPDAGTRTGRVVAGVDGSPPSLLALDFALRQAQTREVPLHVIRATPPAARRRAAGAGLVGAAPTGPDELAEGEAAFLDTERAALDELLAQRRAARSTHPVTTEVVFGGPAAVLVEASRQAQLIVVGSRGLGGFRGMLLGSVSQQLIQHSHSPVAVVRELAGPDAGPAGTARLD